LVSFIALSTPALAGAALAASRAVVSIPATAIQPCVGKAVVKPKAYVIACADANIQLLSMHWRLWSSTKAVGTGLYDYNTCTPTCVSGRFVNDPATVTLSLPKKGSAGRVFSKMVVSYRVSSRHVVNAAYPLPLRPF
jgi:hypothetical protein